MYFAPFSASFPRNLKSKKEKKCIYYFSDLFVIVEGR
jgi:hypothetical protein